MEQTVQVIACMPLSVQLRLDLPRPPAKVQTRCNAQADHVMMPCL